MASVYADVVEWQTRYTQNVVTSVVWVRLPPSVFSSPCGGMADTADLKPVAPRACGFDSHLGYT